MTARQAAKRGSDLEMTTWRLAPWRWLRRHPPRSGRWNREPHRRARGNRKLLVVMNDLERLSGEQLVAHVFSMHVDTQAPASVGDTEAQPGEPGRQAGRE